MNYRVLGYHCIISHLDEATLSRTVLENSVGGEVTENMDAKSVSSSPLAHLKQNQKS